MINSLCPSLALVSSLAITSAAHDGGDLLCCRADRLAQRQRHDRETADFDTPASRDFSRSFQYMITSAGPRNLAFGLDYVAVVGAGGVDDPGRKRKALGLLTVESDRCFGRLCRGRPAD